MYKGALESIIDDYDINRSNCSLDESYLSVFQQKWFSQNATLRSRYIEAAVYKNGLLVGSLPYSIVRNKNGALWGGVGYWGHLAGPALKLGLTPEQQKSVLDELLAQIPRNIRLKFVCRPEAAYSQILSAAFRDAGFVETTSKTYLFPADDPGITTRFNKKHRTHMRAAAKQLDVIDIGATEFITFYKENLSAQGHESFEPLYIAERIIRAGLELNEPQVRVIAALKRRDVPTERDNIGERLIDAAVAIVWDKDCCYLWMLSHRRYFPGIEDRPHADAVKLLIITASEHARSRNLLFDLDGVGSDGADNFYRNVLKAPFVANRHVFRRNRSWKVPRILRLPVDIFGKVAKLIDIERSPQGSS